MKERKRNFIRKIQIKNYKSIKDLTIEFHAGLNIIIGPNGTGKTNFVNAVNSVFTERLHADLPIGFEFSFEFVNVDDEMVTWSGGVQEEILQNEENVKLKTRVYYEKTTDVTHVVTDDSLFGEAIFQFLLNKKVLSHGYCLHALGHLAPLAYVNELKPLTIYRNEHQTLGWSMHDMGSAYFRFKTITLPSKVTRTTIQKIVKINPTLVRHLAHLSPIKNVRITEDYTFQINDKVLQINHLQLIFFVNDEWISWNQLSNGTQHLFYIIAGTLMAINDCCCLMIESPELGMHPDSLYKLMDFLKKQSQQKQIIITTHSPDVMNILETNELHKIVVTYMDKQQGTQMHHLSPQKVKKAQSYMEDLSLKDFWVHSNLEALDETETKN
jgi:predicted ATPase